MCVAPETRGRGLGAAILTALEQAAREDGYAVVRLETGFLQREAIALYERAGYRAIPPYGPFVDDPISVRFERAL